MKLEKKQLIILVFLFTLSVTFSNVHFNWAAIAVDNHNNKQVIELKKNISLSSNATLQFYIEPVNKTYIYAFWFQPNNKMQVIFPQNSNTFDKNYIQAYKIPKFDSYYLDNQQGKHSIQLLASMERFEALDKLIKKYNKSSKNKKSKLVKDIQNIIKKIKRKNSGLASIGEKPIPIAGVFRTRSISNINQYATEVTAENFYSKKITLEIK